MRVSAVLLALCLVGPALGQVVGLEWPDHPVQRALIAYEASSLRAIQKTAARPTLEERLAQAPFVTGESRVALDLTAFDAEAAGAIRAAAVTAGGGSLLAFKTWTPVAEKLYAPRRAPGTLNELQQKHGIRQSPDWTHVDVMSLLTQGRRRIWFDTRRVLEAHVAALEKRKPFAYAPGTWFLAEQLKADGSLIETHVIGLRDDHEQDFLLYDKNGVQGLSSAEFRMRAPTTCFACHRNAGHLPPFADFPDVGSPVNGFQPKVEVDLSASDQAAVRALLVPGERPDDTHGSYGGLAALKVRKDIQAGTAQAWETALWPRLVKLVPALATR